MNRSVVTPWESFSSPIRTGHSGNKTEELIDDTDFACCSGIVAATDLFSSLKAARRPVHALTLLVLLSRCLQFDSPTRLQCL
jgi:hypothetical protein